VEQAPTGEYKTPSMLYKSAPVLASSSWRTTGRSSQTSMGETPLALSSPIFRWNSHKILFRGEGESVSHTDGQTDTGLIHTEERAEMGGRDSLQADGVE
jgi:hypothetical protein